MKSSKSSLFLMELIVSILFFSLASAVCIQLFVKAHVLDKHTDEQNHAIIWSQNLAALWQANEGDLNKINKLIFTDSINITDPANSDGSKTSVDEIVTSGSITTLSSDGKTLSIYFNQDFELCSQSEMAYTITLENKPYDNDLHILSASITLFRNQENIFELPLSLHSAQERGDINE